MAPRFPFHDRPRICVLVAGSLLIVLLTGCSRIEDLRNRYTPASPREVYERTLENAGLAGTALATAWYRVAEEALANPVSPGTPYRESGFFDPVEPQAGAFRLTLKRGQRLLASAAFAAPDSGSLFLDLFRDMAETGLGLRIIARSDSTQLLAFDATASGDYVLRIQPELLAGGRYDLVVQTRASVVFPVSGKDSRAIQSVFGDPRDGGRRAHHGVDIFAPRGTPVVAATDGVVSSTRIGGLGGKTVWVRSPQTGGNLYYAHLSEQLVVRGQRVAAGDTLGLVGNTGNARTTPPHLHFGIYRNGPVDPFPYVYEPPQTPARLAADPGQAGMWMRSSVVAAPIRSGISSRSDSVSSLPRNTSFQVLAAASTYYRVRLPDGTTGYIASAQAESESAPLDQRVLSENLPLHRAPDRDAGGVRLVEAGRPVSVVGQFGDYVRVRTSEGKDGWIPSL